MTPAPARRDVVAALASALVAAALLASLPVVAAGDPDSTGAGPRAGSALWWAVVAVVIAQSVALVWVRRAPTVVLVTVAALPLAVASVVTGGAFSTTSVAVLVAVARAVALRGPARLRWPLLAVLVLVTAAQLVTERGTGQPLLPIAQALSIVAAPAVLGTFLATQRVAREAQRAEVQALAREREALVQAALARERTAMARELHDIAAHHLSGIALMAGAVARQVDTDPSAAKVGVEQLRSQATAVLGDLRRLVGLMRSADHESGGGTGVESVAGIETLVAAHPGAVTLEAPAEPRVDGVGPLAQLAAYRTVQEALANAARHSPGAPCRVVIDDGRDAIVVTVRNEAPTAAVAAGGTPGFGLLGMRERADLTGSDLRHGPTPDGGWEVVLRLPREEDL